MIREKRYLVNEIFVCYYGKTMDVTLLTVGSLKLKGKKASVIVDPKEKMPKNQADLVLFLNNVHDVSKVEEVRLIVEDDGEYEVGGIKVTGRGKQDKGISYSLNIDNINTILAKVSALEKTTETGSEADLAILDVDSELNESLIASIEAKVVALYGEKAQEGIKALGKDVAPTKKLTIAKDKLPEGSEIQVVWLA